MSVNNDIIKQLNDLVNGPLWLDENFKKKITGLSESDAMRRPIAEIHSVAELISHLNVWINACVDRMSGIPNDLKDNDLNDWKNNELLSDFGWDNLKNEFFSAHNRLVELTKTCDEEFLNKGYQSSEFTNKDILFGLIHHDAYHLGQIGITIKLLKLK
ncbi:MAG: DinB family protein [Bacteroidetes bacterium]|nr:DinB family protein [Bacteroidota bacterium]